MTSSSEDPLQWLASIFRKRFNGGLCCGLLHVFLPCRYNGIAGIIDIWIDDSMVREIAAPFFQCFDVEACFGGRFPCRALPRPTKSYKTCCDIFRNLIFCLCNLMNSSFSSGTLWNRMKSYVCLCDSMKSCEIFYIFNETLWTRMFLSEILRNDAFVMESYEII